MAERFAVGAPTRPLSAPWSGPALAARLVPDNFDALLALALRATAGRHAAAARNVVLTILFAQLLAGAGHEGPPHGSAPRPPRRGPSPRPRHAHRTSVTGRRPRG